MTHHFRMQNPLTRPVHEACEDLVRSLWNLRWSSFLVSFPSLIVFFPQRRGSDGVGPCDDTRHFDCRTSEGISGYLRSVRVKVLSTLSIPFVLFIVITHCLQVVLCTDGLANVGIGSLDGEHQAFQVPIRKECWQRRWEVTEDSYLSISMSLRHFILKLERKRLFVASQSMLFPSLEVSAQSKTFPLSQKPLVDRLTV